MQPGCLGVVALGPWLCVPGFRPVCPHQANNASAGANYLRQFFTMAEETRLEEQVEDLFHLERYPVIR